MSKNNLINLFTNSIELSFTKQIFFYLLPETTLAIAICYMLTLLALDIGNGKKKRLIVTESLTILIKTFKILVGLFTILLLCDFNANLFNGYIHVSNYVTAFKLLTTVTALFILTSSSKYLLEHKRSLIEYPVIFALTILFMFFLIGANHLISAFFALVGFSLNLYILIFFDSTTVTAREAGIKYFYLSALSSGLMIYGIFCIFATLKTGNFWEIKQVLTTANTIINNSESLQMGINFLLVGLFFKLSAFPGHLWAPEVYEGSPDPVTALFMLPVKISVLAFVLQLLAGAFENATALWQPWIEASAGLSMVWGCFAALNEKKTKRFFAYASINQIGFILAGIATASFDSYRATILYIFIYAITNIVLLMIFLHARLKNGSNLTYLTDFRGLGQQHWLLSWSVAIILLSMAGIPPLAGFFGKYYLLLHATNQNLLSLVLVGLGTSLISTFYYLRLIKIFWFEGDSSLRTVKCELTKKQAQVIFVVEAITWSFIILNNIIIQSMHSLATGLIVPIEHALELI